MDLNDIQKHIDKAMNKQNNRVIQEFELPDGFPAGIEWNHQWTHCQQPGYAVFQCHIRADFL